jgi:hypothetical protein
MELEPQLGEEGGDCSLPIFLPMKRGPDVQPGSGLRPGDGSFFAPVLPI